jgi:hypothetical protein
VLQIETGLLSSPDEIAEVLRSVLAAESQRGLNPRSECMRVVEVSARFTGWGYKITRELQGGLIDCSTLISQAHWEGAAVATPFVAETQRVAYNAVDVSDAWLPGDVLVRYPSRTASPGGRHNHVALFAGRDSDGVSWMVESRDAFGVRALHVDAEASRGGVRRFLPNPLGVFDDSVALRLAQAVPKLGRLGSRLTFPLVDAGRHRGIDVCFANPVDVLAPIEGTVAYSRSGLGREYWTATITSHASDELIVMRPVERPSPTPVGVHVGDPIGRLASVLSTGCNAIPAVTNLPRLHIGYFSRVELPFFPDRGLGSPSPRLRASCAYEAYNPLYALKLGLIGSPVARAAADFEALSLPLTASHLRRSSD